MPKGKGDGTQPGAWVIRDVPRHLMRQVKIAAVVEGKSVKQLLLDLAEAHVKELEKKGVLPKGKG